MPVDRLPWTIFFENDALAKTFALWNGVRGSLMHPCTFPQALGRRAEDEALAFFVSRGFSFVDRHWTCRAGELDLVLERGSRLHFIEVKARASCRQHPFEAIPFRKRHRLALAISAWLQAHPEAASRPYQVDAYCLWRDQAGHWQRVHLEGI